MDDNLNFPGDLQRVGATVSLLCDNHTTLCSVSTLRLRATLIPFVRFWWLCKQLLINISVQECCVYVDYNCDVVALWMIVSIM